MSWFDDVEMTRVEALAAMESATDMAALEQAKGLFLGTGGRFTLLMKSLGTLPKEERPAAGKTVNAAKVSIEQALIEKREALEMKAALPSEPTDFTLPGRRPTQGRLHPLVQVTDDIVRAFRKLGFAVADGPEIEDEYHCFDALNTPADHPARDSQDTFFVGSTGRPLLRTHTSSV
jgi:phenylalanyl-tRNA synthetase alpha chain